MIKLFHWPTAVTGIIDLATASLFCIQLTWYIHTAVSIVVSEMEVSAGAIFPFFYCEKIYITVGENEK